MESTSLPETKDIHRGRRSRRPPPFSSPLGKGGLMGVLSRSGCSVAGAGPRRDLRGETPVRSNRIPGHLWPSAAICELTSSIRSRRDWAGKISHQGAKPQRDLSAPRSLCARNASALRSGMEISPAIHYGDLIPKWINGETVEMRISRQAVAADNQRHVKYVPAEE